MSQGVRMRRVLACAVAIGVAAVMPLRWGAASAQDKEPASAQNKERDKSRKAKWLADGGDPQRTSWQRDETAITPASAKSMKLLWTVQTDNEPRQLHNLFAPLIVSDVTTANGPREIAVVAGVS